MDQITLSAVLIHLPGSRKFRHRWRRTILYSPGNMWRRIEKGKNSHLFLKIHLALNVVATGNDKILHFLDKI